MLPNHLQSLIVGRFRVKRSLHTEQSAIRMVIFNENRTVSFERLEILFNLLRYK
jgi:hypothetical protein